MKGKHTVIVVTVVSIAVLLCSSSPQGPVESSPVAGPVVSGGDFFLKPPAYDSGWQAISEGAGLTLDHNLGGDTDDYVVDLTFARAQGAHHTYFGGDWVGDQSKGAWWYGLTDTQITVGRGLSDLFVIWVRVRIWVVPEADSDSDWLEIDPGGSLLRGHSIGEYHDILIYLEARSTSYPTIGVHRISYGLDRVRPAVGQPLGWYGFWWDNLEDGIHYSFELHRGADDLFAEEVRVRIWRVPEATFDSGWIDVDQGEIVTLDHDACPCDDLFVDLGFQGGGFAVNHTGYGLDWYNNLAWTEVEGIHGATWENLTLDSIDLHRGLNDLAATKMRVRIWAINRVYLPLVLRDY